MIFSRSSLVSDTFIAPERNRMEYATPHTRNMRMEFTGRKCVPSRQTAVTMRARAMVGSMLFQK